MICFLWTKVGCKEATHRSVRRRKAGRGSSAVIWQCWFNTGCQSMQNLVLGSHGIGCEPTETTAAFAHQQQSRVAAGTHCCVHFERDHFSIVKI